MLKYLKKYEKQLVGHVIQRKGREPFVVCRTNNPVEQRFGSLKRGVRRKAGTKKLTRLVQAMRPEALLIPNLADPEYVNLVLGGSLAELPTKFAEHWSTAQAIRHQRRTDTTDRPMPTTKQQLRNPGLLEKLKRTIKRLAAAALGKKAA